MKASKDPKENNENINFDENYKNKLPSAGIRNESPIPGPLLSAMTWYIDHQKPLREVFYMVSF